MSVQIIAENGCYVIAELGGGIDSRVTGSPPAVTARGKPGDMIDGQPTNGPWQQWQQIANDDGTVSFTCIGGQDPTAALRRGSATDADCPAEGSWYRCPPARPTVAPWVSVHH